MQKIIGNDWDEQLKSVFTNVQFQKLQDFLELEYLNRTIFPKKFEIFRSFQLTDFNDVKVVILGQDPYYNDDQANGLAFSVRPGVKIPPSLRNIFQELENDLGISPPESGDLSPWAKQGVLLLNVVLTVQKGQPNSHVNHGEEEITDAAIKKLSDRGRVVFVLWGGFAQRKLKLIDQTKNTVIKSSHPSPLSSYRGFFGSKPFSQINQALIEYQEAPIDWQL